MNRANVRLWTWLHKKETLDELLITNHLENVILTVTTRCNLRCIYCGVSQPTYHGNDLDMGRLDEMVREFIKSGVRIINYNGHGESTIVPGWEEHCRKFLDAGFKIGITSNFSRQFSVSEIDVLSHMNWIQVSCDTVDRELFRELRRHADFNRLVANMMHVKMKASQNNRIVPTFGWTCVVTDRVIQGLEDWAWYGMVLGVKRFTLSNFIKMPDLPGVNNVRHLCQLGLEEMKNAADVIKRVINIFKDHKIEYELQGDLLNILNEEIRNKQNSLGQRLSKSEVEHVVMNRGIAIKIQSLVPKSGETRECTDPWFFTMVRTNGRVDPCCWYYGDDIGEISTQPFSEVVNGDKVQELRRQLLTGELGDNCRNCPSRGITTPEHLRTIVKSKLRGAN